MSKVSLLPEAIRRLMAKADPPVNQAKLAEKLGIYPSGVSKFFNEPWNPQFSNLERVLQAIGCDLHDLARALDEVEGRGPKRVSEAYLRGFAPGRSADYYRGIADALEVAEGALDRLDEVAEPPTPPTAHEEERRERGRLPRHK